jgi:hypothetical protein
MSNLATDSPLRYLTRALTGTEPLFIVMNNASGWPAQCAEIVH